MLALVLQLCVTQTWHFYTNILFSICLLVSLLVCLCISWSIFLVFCAQFCSFIDSFVPPFIYSCLCLFSYSCSPRGNFAVVCALRSLYSVDRAIPSGFAGIGRPIPLYFMSFHRSGLISSFIAIIPIHFHLFQFHFISFYFHFILLASFSWV